jgi:hypothetical protein
METIKKIINQQKVEERRNSIFYCQIRSMKDGDEFAWIHSMVCVYLHDSVRDDSDDDKNDSKDDNKDDNVNTDTIHDLLDEFETALRWCYNEGIDKAIENIKSFFKDRFIPYTTYLSYLESKQYENKLHLPEVFIKKLLFSKL